ncbi:PAS domain S-box protein [Rhizobacter sp. J219]|uniref:PAS domain S-box protein n=1 Tax=Rhizobacter sp. J219 TaxID=2898430 RepID=UPI00215186F2|nr:PAS domain S-box protein [Rhizobacter sp. J219]MCR5883631.1 PAS domain S-box protein [Rhizobacter sp. J219]
MTPVAPLRPTPHRLLALAGTALAYGIAGWAALWLAIPPGYASPLYPAAGIALACVLTFGWRVLPGVALGAFAVNALTALHQGPVSAATVLLLPAGVAFGAMLQAGLGAWLVRRFASRPLTLSEPTDILVFFGLGAVVSCMVSATVGTAMLHWVMGPLPDTLWFTWSVWASGDTLGVLIAAPVTLTLIGQPRSEWAARRLNVGLTLAVATLLMALGVRQVAHWAEARLHAGFERDAVNASSNLAARMQYPLHALEAVRSAFLASEDVTRTEMRRATQSWLAPGSQLQAMGYAEFMSRSDAPAYEARIRATDFPGFTVFDRRDSTLPQRPDDRLAVMRYIEPSETNAGALGVNIRSIPEARAAVDATVRTDSPAVTAGFRATQHLGDETIVVIYQALYHGAPTTASERMESARGIVFVTLRMEAVLASFRSALPHYLTACVVDTDPTASRRRLAGPAGCETARYNLVHVRPLAFAGRQWDLLISAQRGDLPDARERDALLFSLVGLLATAMLGALLLTVTGRTRRIEAAVQDRTAALQREIAERERTEVDLRESEQRFRNILNNVPIGVVYTDLQGHVRQVNPRFCELTGYSADELMGMDLATLTHPEDRAQNAELSAELVRGDIPMYRRQSRFLTRDKRMVWAQAVVTLLRDAQGAPHRIVGVVEDITEHLRLAEAERAREIAEAANLAKSEFLSRMSHELRTPLNAMLGFAQLLELDQNHPLPAAQRPWVAQIQGAGWHLLDMINDVLDLSRIESGTLNLQPDRLDLREVIAAALPLLEQDARRRHLQVTQDVPDDAARVIGDATRVKQILINLLSNAVKYNSDGGRIHVTARCVEPDMVELVVSDTGLGMTAQQLEQLFQPFNRLGRERTSMEGTGIGLVISQRLAELMGGALRARSTAGAGSSFILTLPRADRPDTTPGPLDALNEGQSTYHQRRVHYVEDNETNVEVMRGILLRRPQVQFDVSVTGLDGLAAIRAKRPDLVLLDMHLPDIDGLDLLRHLKSDPATADIPVVVVSADALASQIEAAMQAGAFHYLTKPVSVAELLSVVDSVLEGAETRFG